MCENKNIYAIICLQTNFPAFNINTFPNMNLHKNINVDDKKLKNKFLLAVIQHKHKFFNIYITHKHIILTAGKILKKSKIMLPRHKTNIISSAK